MKWRISERQKLVLRTIELANVPVQLHNDEQERVIPLYIDHVPSHCFWSESELQRFLKNLEKRGLIRIEKRFFLYLTDAGRAALSRCGGAK